MFEKNVVVMIKRVLLGGCGCGDSLPIGMEDSSDFVRVKVSAESQEALDKTVEILVNHRPPLEEIAGMFD